MTQQIAEVWGFSAGHAQRMWSAGVRSIEDLRRRAGELGLDIGELPVWYDVDDAASLLRLMLAIGSGAGEPYPAPATQAALRRLGLVALPAAAE